MANGQFNMLLSVCFKSIVFPEFVNGRVVNGVREAWVFDLPHCQYNIIFGIDFLLAKKMQFCFDTNYVTWFGEQVEIKTMNYFNKETWM